MLRERNHVGVDAALARARPARVHQNVERTDQRARGPRHVLDRYDEEHWLELRHGGEQRLGRPRGRVRQELRLPRSADLHGLAPNARHRPGLAGDQRVRDGGEQILRLFDLFCVDAPKVVTKATAHSGDHEVDAGPIAVREAGHQKLHERARGHEVVGRWVGAGQEHRREHRVRVDLDACAGDGGVLCAAGVQRAVSRVLACR